MGNEQNAVNIHLVNYEETEEKVTREWWVEEEWGLEDGKHKSMGRKGHFTVWPWSRGGGRIRQLIMPHLVDITGKLPIF